MVALVVMMPLLCLYADLMGIVGGIVVGTGMLDLSLAKYLHRTREAVTMTISGSESFIVRFSACLWPWQDV